jgi:aminoglycoside phosphotransferase family enzyme
MNPPQPPTLAEKVAFLSQPKAYGAGTDAVVARETHMSWVFLVGSHVYKLKKPVRFSYLDFSTLARRETMCRTELQLNRRLAPDVYLDVVPVTASRAGLAIDGGGSVVDWLVVMRRLAQDQTLEARILADDVADADTDRVAATLVRFYRHAARTTIDPPRANTEWRRRSAENLRVLRDPRLGVPAGPVHVVERATRRFLDQCAPLLAERARQRRIVDAHGDLRPEHVWLDHRVAIIDGLEFNARLRRLDFLDELAFLHLECERLGTRWIGERIRRHVTSTLHDTPPETLFLFYRCQRAMLRARLAIAHLLEPNPRTPEKWPRQMRAYLRLAVTDARRLERLLSRRACR